MPASSAVTVVDPMNELVPLPLVVPRMACILLLVVDDDESIRSLVRRVCQTHRIAESLRTLVIVHTPEEALDYPYPAPLTHALIDIDLNHHAMTGVQLAALLLPQHPDMRVTFMTGHSSDVLGSYTDAVLLNCPYEYLSKPFSVDALMTSILNALPKPPPSPPTSQEETPL